MANKTWTRHFGPGTNTRNEVIKPFHINPKPNEADEAKRISDVTCRTFSLHRPRRPTEGHAAVAVSANAFTGVVGA